MTRNSTDDLQQFLDDLTPAEREAISNATAQDWMDALSACVKDPTFWQGIGAAFLQGVMRGVNDYLDGDR
jgi:hypothetical protein